MIRLRHTPERAPRQPPVGPLVLALLLLLLILVALQTIHDGPAAGQLRLLGPALLLLTVLLGTPRGRRPVGRSAPASAGDRAPPRAERLPQRAPGVGTSLVVPLRRRG